MAAQNKRILCFIDECGTAGEPGFALGCVMAWARECGRADKSLSDLLEPNANELHAANLSREYLQSLLARFAQTDRPEGMILMNRLGTVTEGTAPAIYAGNVIETVKVAVGQFRKLNRIRGQGVGNVELILDLNHHNTVSARFLPQRLVLDAGDNVWLGDEVVEEAVPLFDGPACGCEHITYLVDAVVGQRGDVVVVPDMDADDIAVG